MILTLCICKDRKRCCNGAKVFTFVVEDKGIVLHGDVKFSEKFVTGLTVKYVLDSRWGRLYI